jgi:PAS domain S-box-containing protein
MKGTVRAIRILMLEDLATDAELAIREMKRGNLKVEVRRVETEAAFRHHLVSSFIDIVLADYNVPGFDGFAALEISRELAPETPFIFVSGSIGEERAVMALQGGATDYILKDRMSRLPLAITRALRERQELDLRRSANEALRLMSQRFEYASRAATDGIWDWDILTDRVWVGGSVRKLIGEDAQEEHPASWWFDHVHPDDAARVSESLRAAVHRGEDDWSAEYRFRRGDGSYALVIDRAFTIHDRRGNPLRVVGALQDVTENRAQEAMLRQSEQRFRSVAETAPDAIILIDSSNAIRFWNRGSAATFGYTQEEILGRSALELFPEDAREERAASLDALRSDPTSERAASLIAVCNTGRRFEAEGSFSAWNDGNEVFITAIFRDITERRRAEASQATQLAVTRILAHSRSVPHAAAAMLRALSDGFGLDGGALWLRAASGETQRAALRVREGGEERAYQGPATRFPVVRSSGIDIGTLELYHSEAVLDAETTLLVSSLVTQLSDFVERSEREEELARTAERLNEAQSLAHLGNWELDPVTAHMVWSDETRRIFGVGPHDSITWGSFINAIHPEDRDRVTKLLHDLQRQGGTSSVKFTHRIIRGAGEERTLRCVCSLGPASRRGGASLLVGTVHDVTEGVLARRTIEELARRNELSLAGAADGIIGFDAQAQTTFANPAALSMFGWRENEIADHAEMHRRVHHTRADGSPYPIEDCPIARTLEDGRERSSLTDIFWRADGSPFTAQWSVAPIVDGDAVAGAVITVRDLTDRKQLESRLEQANRINSLGRVAATIAHEFNNVLMGISPFAEVVRRRSAADPKNAAAADQILESVRRGRRVTDEILRFTKPVPLVLQIRDLSAWLRSIGAELRAMARENIRIEIDGGDVAVPVACDSAQLQQVLANIVVNACDAITGTGRVRITLRVSEGDARAAEIVIEDDGVGIAENAIEHIFEPLFTTKRFGTGIGLGVVRQIVLQHGGDIRAQNSPRGGAMFHITLPMAEEQVVVASSVPAEERPRPILGVKRVVLIDDDGAVAAGIAMLLESEGMIVHIVRDGAGALPAIETFAPDAVVLDLTLTDMDGLDVFTEIEKRWPDLPVVFSTGHGTRLDVEEAVRDRHVGFVSKPYPVEDLLAELARLR